MVHHCLPHPRRGLSFATHSLHLSIAAQPITMQRIRMRTPSEPVVEIRRAQNNKLAGNWTGRWSVSKCFEYCHLQNDSLFGSIYGVHHLHAFFRQLRSKIWTYPHLVNCSGRFRADQSQQKYIYRQCGTDPRWSRMRVQYEDQYCHFELDCRLSSQTKIFVGSTVFVWRCRRFRVIWVLLA